MKNIPDDKSVDFLLKGTISKPSDRFEEALRNIPRREHSRSRLKRLWVMAPLAAAAMLILTTILVLDNDRTTQVDTPAIADSIEDLDSDWLEVFSLADSLAQSDSLINEETRMALEFYAFNQ